ncbi:GPI-anchored cell wall organization protein ecm33 [Microdochium bolleyi]|uniref:GPI-anchored cell wall organization protein ecm33 n=1 Tax=Microdochium bolleyi TaxID=196109 RepID=A0A136J0N2_9PEZI|nr:GPI-anchored cell wall organization protein ecm33 [Microdochium bolleyi]
MYTKQILSAVAALSFVSGAVAIDCQDPTATVQSSADATAVAKCGKFDGNIVISKSYSGAIDLGGLQRIGGDLTALDNENITSLSANFLQEIGGKLSLKNLINLSGMSLMRLSSVDTIEWVTLRKLANPTLGITGITKASSILVADTTIKTLEGLNVDSLSFINLNNNREIVTFKSNIKSISDRMIIDSNGLKMQMDMPNLIWASNLTISNVTTFSAPALKTINGSMSFSSNYFTSVSFPNLTKLEEGTFSFISNPQLTNLTLPLLKSVGGGLVVANNTALSAINGFPTLETVGGAIGIRGSFKNFSLPALDDVRGGAEITSTEDIQANCDKFKSDKGSEVQGKLSCEGKNADANSNTGSANGGGSGSSGNNSGNNAGAIGVNMATLLSLGAVGVFYSAFL